MRPNKFFIDYYPRRLICCDLKCFWLYDQALVHRKASLDVKDKCHRRLNVGWKGLGCKRLTCGEKCCMRKS